MIGKTRFNKLLEPSHIGQVKIRNRMVKTGAGVAQCYRDGNFTDTFIALNEAIAKGGVGLLIVGSASPDYPLGIMLDPSAERMDSDECIPRFSKLTQAIHKHGCPTFLQLVHAGAWHQAGASELQPVSSSVISRSEFPPGPSFDEPRELTIAEIEELVDKFARAAERAQKAGFDGVELNAGTCHLFNSFLSRVWNKRQDAYGCGDLESRARFLVETIQAIKRRLGQGFPINVLINGAEFGVEKGTTPEESQGFARILEKAGADSIEVRAYGYGDYYQVIYPEEIFYPAPAKPLVKVLDWSRKGAGGLVPLAAAIKKVVSIPVMTVGRLDPELGEEVLQQGKSDFIGMTRRLLADPELPNKIASGNLEDIRPCTACLYCISTVEVPEPVRCRVNAAVGGAREHEVKPADKKKRVVVVGGGPAGMEAARVAALRGHEVTLFETERKLGGSLPLAAVVKGLEIEDLTALIRYLRIQITKLGVKVRLGTMVNLPVIEEIKPDVVILATGGIPTLPDIPGINRSNVVSSLDLHRRLKTYLKFLNPTALRWLARFWMPLGKRVVIIGGAIQGCELAEFLVKRGRKITIADTAEALGDGLARRKRARLFRWLAKNGVTMMTEVRYEEITDKGLTIVTKEGERQTIEADTIVPAMSLRPNTELFKILDGKVPEIHLIGDCKEPRLIIDAIADGSRIASAI